MRECEELVRKLTESRLNPTKLAILLFLSISGWSKLTEVSKALGIAKSTAWKHIREMKDKGLVKVEYSLDPHPQMIVAITSKGLEVLNEYIGIMEKVKECIGREEKGNSQTSSK